MDILLYILTLLGAMALFLYGMKMMSQSIQKIAANQLRSLITSLTKGSISSVLLGVAITAIIQSSTAATVMVVSFVNAGILSLSQSVGIIMGANIGTTVTAWIIALVGMRFNLFAALLPAIAVGFFLMISRVKGRNGIGELIIGASLLLLGLWYMNGTFPPAHCIDSISAAMAQWSSHGFVSVLLFTAIGVVITVLLRASSATIALTILLVGQGFISFPMGVAMLLGENLGTTFTANVASSMTNVSAKRAARVHLLFNLIGVILSLCFFAWFISLVSMATSHVGCDNPMDPGAGKNSLMIAVAMAHTLFNVLNMFVQIWFKRYIVKAVTSMVSNPKAEEEVFKLQFLRGGLLNTAELSLGQAKAEIVHFAQLCKREWGYARVALNSDSEEVFEEHYRMLEHYEQITDRIEYEIAQYLTEISQGEVSHLTGLRIQAMYRIIGELESMGDSGFNIARIIKKRNFHKVSYSPAMLRRLNGMFDLVDSGLEALLANLQCDYGNLEEISNARRIEHDINEMRTSLKEEHLISLENKEYDYTTGVYYMDMVNEVEQMGDYIINISEAIEEIK